LAISGAHACAATYANHCNQKKEENAKLFEGGRVDELLGGAKTFLNLRATKKISAGDEVLFNYGYEPFCNVVPGVGDDEEVGEERVVPAIMCNNWGELETVISAYRSAGNEKTTTFAKVFIGPAVVDQCSQTRAMYAAFWGGGDDARLTWKGYPKGEAIVGSWNNFEDHLEITMSECSSSLFAEKRKKKNADLGQEGGYWSAIVHKKPGVAAYGPPVVADSSLGSAKLYHSTCWGNPEEESGSHIVYSMCAGALKTVNTALHIDTVASGRVHELLRIQGKNEGGKAGAVALQQPYAWSNPTGTASKFVVFSPEVSKWAVDFFRLNLRKLPDEQLVARRAKKSTQATEEGGETGASATVIGALRNAETLRQVTDVVVDNYLLSTSNNDSAAVLYEWHKLDASSPGGYIIRPGCAHAFFRCDNFDGVCQRWWWEISEKCANDDEEEGGGAGERGHAEEKGGEEATSSVEQQREERIKRTPRLLQNIQKK
jgi:hypothetical protein